MKKILLPIFAFILAACATNSPAPTPTLTPIPPTFTATATPTLTPTPTITFTPTPELPSAIILDIVSRFPGYTVEGNAFKDSKGNILPNLTIEPSADGKTWRGIVPPYKYEHEDEDGNVTTYAMTVETSYKAEEFSLNAAGNLTYPAHEWRAGEWVRKTVILNEGKSEEVVTKIALYSVSEVARVLLIEKEQLQIKLGAVFSDKDFPAGWSEEYKQLGLRPNVADLPEKYKEGSASQLRALIKPDHWRTTYAGTAFVIYPPKQGVGKESGILSSSTV